MDAKGSVVASKEAQVSTRHCGAVSQRQTPLFCYVAGEVGRISLLSGSSWFHHFRCRTLLLGSSFLPVASIALQGGFAIPYR